MSQNQTNIDQQKSGQSAIALTADDEIKQLKEFIQQIYFKEGEDTNTKEDLLTQIQELELIKLDEDFYQHLSYIYQQITLRQESNLKEFKNHSQQIDEQRKLIEEKDQEILKVSNDLIQNRLEDIKANLKIIDNQFNQLEKSIFESEKELSYHISEICQTVGKTQEEFERDIQDVCLAQYESSEHIARRKEEYENKKSILQKNQKDQENLKLKMLESDQQLNKICSQIQKLEIPETKKSLLEQADQDDKLLIKIREQLDIQISQRKVDFKQLEKDNSIVEKRYSYIIQQLASTQFKGRQREQLKHEVDRMLQDYNNLRQKLQITQENTQKVNEEIAMQRKKKGLKTDLYLFLIIIIILFSLYLLYRFF